jgi:hypothetical protein
MSLKTYFNVVSLPMYTIIELPTFTADADELWSEQQRAEFCTWLVNNPDAGDVIPGASGCRKVRWSLSGTGKRGGVRVIYFNRLPEGLIYLLAIFSKSVQGDVPLATLRAIKDTINEN